MNQHLVVLRSKALRMHQRITSLPGACEALCHWRGTTEPMAANTLEPLVAADLFGNSEWPRTRQALRTHFPEASAWTEWQHQTGSVTFLPTGEFATNRGAEQGPRRRPRLLGSHWRLRGAWQRQELRSSSLPARAHAGVSGMGHAVHP